MDAFPWLSALALTVSAAALLWGLLRLIDEPDEPEPCSDYEETDR